jgi:putative membrane protein
MANVSDYLAAERTFLAWIRTGLALMGFGFVVARFGLFLQQIQFIQHGQSKASYGLSLWFGTALIVAGILVNILSAVRHLRLVQDLDHDKTEGARSPILAIATALFLALIGLVMAIYLLSVRGS